jgi:hypothetical protein
MPDELALVVDSPSPRVIWVLDHVLRSAGYRAVRTDRAAAADRPHLAYGGSGPAGPRGAWIAEVPGDVAWPPLLDGSLTPESNGPRIERDLVHAIGELLTDAVHDGTGPEDRDAHGRLRHEASWSVRNGIGDRPLVDLYTGFIGAVVAATTGMAGEPRWPDGRAACVALSHDVDEPDRYALLGHAWRPWRLRRAPRTLVTESVRLARARRTDPDPDAYWTFPELMALEARHGFRSTHFFAVTPFHAAAGALEDVAYDPGAPRYRRVMAELREGGFGIGLHAGYRAFEDPVRFAHERRALEELAGGEVVGLRHHYWHLGPDEAATLRAHEAAGFRYDSSVAFNDHVGFRRSAGLPYRPFDTAERRALRTWQLPPFCMDGNLFYASDDVEAAVAAVAALVDEIVTVGGFGAIDWHIQASLPRSVEFRGWGVAYGEILDLLAARPTIWVTSLEEVLGWIERRADGLGVVA